MSLLNQPKPRAHLILFVKPIEFLFFYCAKKVQPVSNCSIVHAELAITMYVPLTLQGIHLINSLIDEYSLPVVQAYMKYIQVCFQGPLQLAVT